jgi:hypothetical protein
VKRFSDFFDFQRKKMHPARMRVPGAKLFIRVRSFLDFLQILQNHPAADQTPATQFLPAT